MKLVTFGDGDQVGYVDGEEIAVLDVPSMREYFEAAARTRPASASRSRTRGCARRSSRRSSSTRPATSASTRRSRSSVGWSHEIAPWIVFFQNVDAIVGPDEPVVYPEHLTEELDYELELAVVMRARPASGSRRRRRSTTSAATSSSTTSPRATSSGARCARASSRFCKAIDTFCPLGPWIVTPDEIPDPHDLAMELRVNGEVAADVALEPEHVRDDPGDPQPLLGARLLGRRRRLDRHGRPASPASRRTRPRSTSSPAT